MLNKKKFYINGKWTDPIKEKDCYVIDPSTEENCAVISIGGKEDVDAAVQAAKNAFGSWAFTSKDETLFTLHAFPVSISLAAAALPNTTLVPFVAV